MLQDSHGTKLREYGLQDSRADRIVYVCFDNHPGIGRRFHFIWADHVKYLLARDRRKGLEPVLGSSSEIEVKNTGAGFLYTPKQLQARSFPLPPRWRSVGTIAEQSTKLVRAFYEFRGFRIYEAKLTDQLNQIDFFIVRGRKEFAIEVKSRGASKKFDKLFVQTHETNPGGMHA